MTDQERFKQEQKNDWKKGKPGQKPEQPNDEEKPGFGRGSGYTEDADDETGSPDGVYTDESESGEGNLNEQDRSKRDEERRRKAG